MRPASSVLDGGLHGDVLAAEGDEDDGLDDAHDGALIGVVGAELSALVGVEAALEEGAEDGGLNLGPVEVGGVGDDGEVVFVEREDLGAVEEAAVEPLDAVGAEPAVLVGHGAEECGEAGGEVGGFVAGAGDEFGEEVAGEEAGVLGEEAEEEFVEEMGDLVRVVAAGLKTAGEFGELAGGLLGDLLAGARGAEGLRLAHDGAEDAEGLLGAVAELVEVEGVDLLGRVGEVGVDLEALQVADNQEGRVFQGLAILEQLLVGGGEVLVLALILPAEVAALPDVRPPSPPPVFSTPFSKAYQSPGGIGLVGGGDAEQAAEVDEVFLGGGAFGASAAEPLRGELGGGEGGSGAFRHDRALSVGTSVL